MRAELTVFKARKESFGNFRKKSRSKDFILYFGHLLEEVPDQCKHSCRNRYLIQFKLPQGFSTKPKKKKKRQFMLLLDS